MYNSTKKNIKDNFIVKFFLGFLFPYVIINGLILFIIIDKPSINVLTDLSEQEKIDHIQFSIENILPIINVSVTNNDKAINFSKAGQTYTFPINENGSYKIEATAINKMTVTTFCNVDTLDDVSPTINLTDATYSAGILTFTISDNDSGINYDNLYGIINNEKTSPHFIDKPTGTIKFKISTGQSITIHVEDNNGNISETTFKG